MIGPGGPQSHAKRVNRRQTMPETPQPSQDHVVFLACVVTLGAFLAAAAVQAIAR